MCTIPHNEWNNDTLPVYREDSSWNNKQVHAEVLWTGFNLMERKIHVSQTWIAGEHTLQKTA